jgi:large subunit ribosomal protein L24
MKLKVNDKVLIIAGKDKGKVGKITRIVHKHNRIVVENVNMRTKHIKKQPQRAGEKIVYEAPFSASNAMILDPGMNKPTRIGYKVLENGKKERISKISGVSLDNIPVEAAAEETAPKKKTSTAKKASKKVIKA